MEKFTIPVPNSDPNTCKRETMKIHDVYNHVAGVRFSAVVSEKS